MTPEDYPHPSIVWVVEIGNLLYCLCMKIRILMRTIPPERYRPGKGCVYDTRGVCATLITGWGNTAPFILESYEIQTEENRLLHQTHMESTDKGSGL